MTRVFDSQPRGSGFDPQCPYIYKHPYARCPHTYLLFDEPYPKLSVSVDTSVCLITECGVNDMTK